MESVEQHNDKKKIFLESINQSPENKHFKKTFILIGIISNTFMFIEQEGDSRFILALH